MVGLAPLQDGDPAAMEALYRRAIAAGSDDWSGHAAVALAGLLKRRGDMTGAAAALRQLIATGSTAWASHAALDLGELLEGTGDAAGASAAWQQLIDAANPEWAGAAFLRLVNLLRGEEDAARLRAPYQAAVALGNPEALYALDQLGQLLHDQGDVEGAHAVWQEAIDAGYENAEDLRDQMMPVPEKRRQLGAYPERLPPEFNPASMLRTRTCSGILWSLPVSTLALTCAMSRSPPAMPIRAPRCGTTGPATTWIATRTASWPPTWLPAPSLALRLPRLEPRETPGIADERVGALRRSLAP
jgi:hypothetical protein